MAGSPSAGLQQASRTGEKSSNERRNGRKPECGIATVPSVSLHFFYGGVGMAGSPSAGLQLATLLFAVPLLALVGMAGSPSAGLQLD